VQWNVLETKSGEMNVPSGVLAFDDAFRPEVHVVVQIVLLTVEIRVPIPMLTLPSEND
jgi:hypothetical protein